MQRLLGLFLLVLLGACQQSKKADVPEVTPPTVFEKLQLSPMSLLMEQMYAENVRLKTAIENGSTDLGVFPESIQNIVWETLTDPTDRDSFFDTQAISYLEKQQLVYAATDPKGAFNEAVAACIACHQKKCTGPLIRIKKLLIK